MANSAAGPLLNTEMQKATLYLYRKGLRSVEIHEWVFLEGSMTVTFNFAENTLSVTQYTTL